MLSNFNKEVNLQTFLTNIYIFVYRDYIYFEKICEKVYFVKVDIFKLIALIKI